MFPLRLVIGVQLAGQLAIPTKSNSNRIEATLVF